MCRPPLVLSRPAPQREPRDGCPFPHVTCYTEKACVGGLGAPSLWAGPRSPGRHFVAPPVTSPRDCARLTSQHQRRVLTPASSLLEASAGRTPGAEGHSARGSGRLVPSAEPRRFLDGRTIGRERDVSPWGWHELLQSGEVGDFDVRAWVPQRPGFGGPCMR